MAEKSSHALRMPPKRLFSRIARIEKIDADLRSRMFVLFETYYVDVEFSRFEKDLNEKTHVFLFYDRATRDLVGFSTIYRKRMPDIAPGLFLFSGDTVLREDCWGSKVLQKCFFRYIVESKLMSPHRPVYWMLMSKGFKTYMMMRMNFGRSYPNHRRGIPARFKRVRDRYYAKKFGTAYDESTGLIRFERSLGAVKGSMAAPTSAQTRDADVRYFMKANPGYQDGVELACVAEIRFSDFAGHIPKFFLKLGRRGLLKSARRA